MLKRIMIPITLGILLSSCSEIAMVKYAIEDMRWEAKIKKITGPYYAKDGGWAYKVNKEVNNVVKEVLKRPINKEIQFKEIKVLIPENTKLNLKTGTIVDMKTGYGLPIDIYTKNYCDDVLSDSVKSKKRLMGKYYHIIYYSKTKETKALFEKISKVNGFTDGGCKE